MQKETAMKFDADKATRHYLDAVHRIAVQEHNMGGMDEAQRRTHNSSPALIQARAIRKALEDIFTPLGKIAMLFDTQEKKWVVQHQDDKTSHFSRVAAVDNVEAIIRDVFGRLEEK